MLKFLLEETLSIFSQKSINSLTAVHNLVELSSGFGMQNEMTQYLENLGVEKYICDICIKVYSSISEKIQEMIEQKQDNFSNKFFSKIFF